MRSPARELGRTLMVPVWALVIGLLVIAVGHIVAFDRIQLFMLADAYTLWIYLPAYPIAIAAVCFRHWLLALAAAALVVAQLIWVVTPMLQTVPITAAARRAPRLRIASQNLNFVNSDHAPILDALAHDGADIIFLEELTPTWWSAVQTSGLLASHPHYVDQPRFDPGGMAILSKLPLTDVNVYQADFWPIITAAVKIGDVTVHVAGVHLVAPLVTFARNQRQQKAITTIVRALPQPRVVAGDFNATPYNRWFQQLLGLGLREAADAVGRPLATTWPNGQHHDLPPLRLDHVFADTSIVPVSVAEGRGAGSDHRPIIVNLAVLQHAS